MEGLEIKVKKKGEFGETAVTKFSCASLQSIKPPAVDISLGRNPPHSLPAAQAKMLRQSHDSFSCLAGKHACLTNDFITQPNRIIPL